MTTNYDNDDDEHSPEYKKIMGQTDVTLTMSKYAKKDGDSLKVDGMIEEERRSKAYSKIIGQSSAQQLVRMIFLNPMKITLVTNSSPWKIVDQTWQETNDDIWQDLSTKTFSQTSSASVDVIPKLE